MKIAILIFIVMLLALSCKKWNLEQKPDIITYPVSDITCTSVTTGGEIKIYNGDIIKEVGICYGFHSFTTIYDSVYKMAPLPGKFICNINGLKINTKYYLRAYIKSELGYTYGNEESFNTAKGGDIPLLTTTLVTHISHNSANISAILLYQGLSAVITRGFCWSRQPSPALSNDTINVSGDSIGSFSGLIKPLEKNTLYYARCFVTNQQGTFYGNILNFTTPDGDQGVPGVKTFPVSSVTQTTALCGGEVLSDSGFSVIKRGVCWAKQQHPTIHDNFSEDGMGEGSFYSILSGLDPYQSYYVRAYATNSEGTGYGQEFLFTTLNLSGALPTVLTDMVSGVTTNSAICGGIVSAEGSYPVSLRGVCWSIGAGPDIFDNKTQDGFGTGYFTSMIPGLSEYTTYHVRAYASNSAGTSYGNEAVFTTAGNSGFFPGQHYGGGIIFYIDNTGQHGLIATENDIDITTWGCYSTYITGATDTAIGTGMQNTLDIVTGCADLQCAAHLCYNLNLNGFTDWFLPSLHELNQLYVNRQYVGNLNTGYYWSSSQVNANEAWQQNFSSGNRIKYGKYDPSAVRAIRKF